MEQGEWEHFLKESGQRVEQAAKEFEKHSRQFDKIMRRVRAAL